MAAKKKQEPKMGWFGKSVIAVLLIAGIIFLWMFTYASLFPKEQKADKIVRLEREVSAAAAEHRQAVIPPVVVEKVQVLRVWIPPCSNPGDRTSWGPAVKFAGKAKPNGNGDFVDEFEDYSLVNFKGQPQKVYLTWYQEGTEEIPQRAVINEDFSHVVDPIPNRIESDYTFAAGYVPTQDKTGVRKFPETRTIRIGSKSKKGFWEVFVWHAVNNVQQPAPSSSYVLVSH